MITKHWDFTKTEQIKVMLVKDVSWLYTPGSSEKY